MGCAPSMTSVARVNAFSVMMQWYPAAFRARRDFEGAADDLSPGRDPTVADEARRVPHVGLGGEFAAFVDAPVRNLAFGGATTEWFLQTGTWVRSSSRCARRRRRHPVRAQRTEGARPPCITRRLHRAAAQDGDGCSRPRRGGGALHLGRAPVVRRRSRHANPRRLPERGPRPRTNWTCRSSTSRCSQRGCTKTSGMRHPAPCCRTTRRASRGVARGPRRRHALPRGGRAADRGVRRSVAAGHRARKRMGLRAAPSWSAEARPQYGARRRTVERADPLGGPPGGRPSAPRCPRSSR